MTADGDQKRCDWHSLALNAEIFGFAIGNAPLAFVNDLLFTMVPKSDTRDTGCVFRSIVMPCVNVNFYFLSFFLSGNKSEES